MLPNQKAPLGGAFSFRREQAYAVWKLDTPWEDAP